MPSPYQGDFFRELTQRPQVDLRVVFAEKIEPMRIGLGWTESGQGYHATFLAHPKDILRAVRIAWAQRDRVHVVNGMWATPAFFCATVLLFLVGADVFFHAETSDPREYRTGLRIAVRNFIGRVFLNRSRGIFAISQLAERFYASIGARPAHIYPFAYFKAHRFLAKADAGAGLREILFVGQLIERKGVIELLEAFRRLVRETPARLTFVGTGPLDERLRGIVAEAGLMDSVRFEGAVSSSLIDERIRQSDVLVLPSQFDGWGLVINEALVSGVPVVLSSNCGAADLVLEPSAGRVFPVGDIDALMRALQAVLQGGLRPNPLAWRDRIGLAVAVDYFLGCLDYGRGQSAQKPQVPWRNPDRSA